MSRPIVLTEEQINEARQEFASMLKQAKVTDGKLSYTKIFSKSDRKATVEFTNLAWRKMTALILNFEKEIAWHGVAKRIGDESEDRYEVSDIVVYPQRVDGTNVDMDPEEYEEWMRENLLAEDERFYSLRMHGHSHVNMGCTASATDLSSQTEFVQNLSDTDFYIFMIWNKRLQHTAKIYDMKKNVLFEDSDITVLYKTDEIDIFVEQAKGAVKDIVRVTKVKNWQKYSSDATAFDQRAIFESMY